MILHHIPHHAGRIVVIGAGAHRYGLRHRYLHVVHVVPVPYRLEDGIGEPQNQQVLHRFLAQVVVDAEYLVFLEHVVHRAVQLLGGLFILPERLLNHHAPPAVLLGRQTGLA